MGLLVVHLLLLTSTRMERGRLATGLDQLRIRPQGREVLHHLVLHHRVMQGMGDRQPNPYLSPKHRGSVLSLGLAYRLLLGRVVPGRSRSTCLALLYALDRHLRLPFPLTNRRVCQLRGLRFCRPKRKEKTRHSGGSRRLRLQLLRRHPLRRLQPRLPGWWSNIALGRTQVHGSRVSLEVIISHGSMTPGSTEVSPVVFCHSYI